MVFSIEESCFAIIQHPYSCIIETKHGSFLICKVLDIYKLNKDICSCFIFVYSYKVNIGISTIFSFVPSFFYKIYFIYCKIRCGFVQNNFRSFLPVREWVDQFSFRLIWIS
ncbi:hypothetical protein EDEG_02542 [Edhazardia aedis USNM 41457]|uniref:Uncharacterized protein n=1 Tax=Edhazardia aedis (strain USNM 41457) TaxID=1003232 RepID=J8ZTU7_EDHAE|nr:hypothetical protein EDEG_02542 [Edhazardia aedis USNM 41457]|eukprot:EJW03063.1 hypothetical protein EDEG_02542 [Edhazardia aedis USNM 41457]